MTYNAIDELLPQARQMLSDIDRCLGISGVTVSHPKEIEFSDDYRACRIGDVPYTFSAIQAACMRAIWELSKGGRHSVAQDSVIDAAVTWSKFKSKRLDHVFRRGRVGGKERHHPLWGTFIQPDPTKTGYYQIVKP